MTSSEIIARGKEVLSVEIAGLERTREALGDSFARAAQMIYDVTEADGLVLVTGVGKSLHVAEKASAIFSSTGTRSVVLDPVQAMHGDLGLASPRDVLLALSFSGESDELVKLLPAIRRHGLGVVSMTGSAASTLAQAADVHVEIPCGKEACPFGMAPTTSSTATMAVCDALAMALVEMRRFDVAHYAANHPAGAIGRALVLKVADVMRTGAHLASVSPETSVLDALLAMTKAQAGSAVVVDGERKLLGIFTDGDFRRLVSASGADAAPVSDLLAAPVSRFMTASPRSIAASCYAVELLKTFAKLHVDDLPVLDDAGCVAGVVDVQDLPKMKVL